MNYDMYYCKENEKPLDVISELGGFCSIFRSIGCIGDSLSSGEFAVDDENNIRTYHDMYEYSWGQFIARRTGSKVYNFSKGGMDAKTYLNSYALENGFFDSAKKCQAYILALTVNDITMVKNGELALGDKEDICNDLNNIKDSFIGYYTAIILKYKKIAPNAKFFLVTCPKCVEDESLRASYYDEVRELLYEVAKKYTNTYVLDLREYAPIHDQKFVDTFYMAGHLTPAGYKISADTICSYIDYLIRKYPRDFVNVGFINSNDEEKLKYAK